MKFNKTVSFFLNFSLGLSVGFIAFNISSSKIEDPLWLVLLTGMIAMGISDAALKVMNGEILAWNYLTLRDKFLYVVCMSGVLIFAIYPIKERLDAWAMALSVLIGFLLTWVIAEKLGTENLKAIMFPQIKKGNSESSK